VRLQQIGVPKRHSFRAAGELVQLRLLLRPRHNWHIITASE
jgi:hypothetical protein